MVRNVKRVLVCGHRHQDQYIPQIIELLGRLSAAGVFSWVERRFADYLAAAGVSFPAGCMIADAPVEDADAAISIGGDGTFLRAARWIGSLQIPILGVNTGHLGFLATYAISETPSLVDTLLSGDVDVESRTVLEITDPDMPEEIFPYALNDVAILKDDTSSMISVHLSLADIFLADYKADGLVVATPTGSTGYSLSAGGPIMQPTLDTLCISPIAPHTLTLRPMVVAGDSTLIALTRSRAGHYRVSLDGVSYVKDTGSSISIRKAPFKVNLMRRPSENFASTLRNKLLWGQR